MFILLLDQWPFEFVQGVRCDFCQVYSGLAASSVFHFKLHDKLFGDELVPFRQLGRGVCRPSLKIAQITLQQLRAAREILTCGVMCRRQFSSQVLMFHVASNLELLLGT